MSPSSPTSTRPASAGTLYVANTQTGLPTKLVGPVDVVDDVCEPTIQFGGQYLIASYCTVGVGERIDDPALPDGGTNFDIATVSAFAPSGGTWQMFTLATKAESSVGVDVNGTTAVMQNTSGLVATPIPGDGGLVEIDPAGSSWVLSSDGKSVVYTTTTNGLKRASTTAPADPTTLGGPLNYINGLSGDGNWVVGGLNYVASTQTGDLYAASAQPPGQPIITLSKATTAETYQNSVFTADSKYAIYATGYSGGAGALAAYALGSSAGATTQLGPGSFWVQPLRGSQVVFNTNYASSKADLQWRDLSGTATSATPLVQQANGYFVVGPAGDAIVYTFSNGGDSDGLWVLYTSEISPGCTPEPFYPPAGGPGSCGQNEIETYDSDCLSSSAPADGCTTAENAISSECYQCLESNWGNSQWAVILTTPGGSTS